MNVNDVLDYVKHTPENTNPNVLSGMLNSLVADNADFTNLKGYTVEFKQWPIAWLHQLDFVQTDGTIHDSYNDEEVSSDIINNVVLLAFSVAIIDSASGLVKKLNGTIIDLSELEAGSVLPSGALIPLSNIEVTYTQEQ